MCDATVALLTISALSAGTAAYSTDQQRKAVNVSNDNQRTAIHAAAIENYSQANRQGVEDRENQTVAQSQIERERSARLATARTSAAAAGVAGTSVDALMLDLAGKGLEASATSEANYARQVAAREDQVANIGINRNSQLASVRDQGRSLGLDLAGSGLQIASNYYGTQVKTQQKLKS